MRAKTLIVTAWLACAPTAHARHSHSRNLAGFASSSCVSFACYSKHPGGIWRHPLTVPIGRSSRSRGYRYPG
jgi:hypothetical protein